MPAKTIASREAKRAGSAPYNGYRFYSFRIWYGMVGSAWLSLLVRNRFAISPARLPFTLFGSFTSALNSILSLVQSLIFGRRIRACAITEAPIFIIGHWRTGTTLLHELLMLDDRFTAPSTLECFAPADCMVLRQLLRHLFNFALPPRRPMDNMPLGWDHPQEDEFALMNLGLSSPYEVVIFPNHRRVGHPFLDMSSLPPEQIQAWKSGFLNFLQQVNLRSKNEQSSGIARRIVLKSPHHTARLHILRQIFPEAKFVHMVRNPCEVFASTVQLWRALFDTQGCQNPRFGALAGGVPDIEEYVFDGMDFLYHNFFKEIAEVPARNFCQVRYEDLARAPIEELARIYEELQFGSFDNIRPKLEAYVRELEGYKPNQHSISPHQRAQICRRWDWYMRRFGYQARSAP